MLLLRLSLRISASQRGISAKGVLGVDMPEGGLYEGSKPPPKGRQPVAKLGRLFWLAAKMLAVELLEARTLELDVDRDLSAYEVVELLELDSTGRFCVRAEARRRGKDRVGRGGDMLLFDRVGLTAVASAVVVRSGAF